MPKMLGSINCYIGTKFTYKKKVYYHNGTTLNLVQILVGLGAKPGDKFIDDQGRIRKVLPFGGGDREGTKGYWVTQWNTEF